MILDTRRMFVALLEALDIDTVADVGSMNGRDALAFQQAAPHARVQAFEANPRNVEAMRADPALREHKIDIVPLAITNFDGESEFHLVKADYSTANNRRGMSSLLERPDPLLRESRTVVQTARLDTCLARGAGTKRRIALWVDVEGKACEALEGAEGLFDELLLIHVEVETTACIAPGQRLYPELHALLRGAGFEVFATDHPTHFEQFNALFVRGDLAQNERLRISRLAAWLSLRTRAIRTLLRMKRAWR